jgi:hypothetical protein
MVRLGYTPVLLIHGEKDSYIPPAESAALHDLARGPRSLWIAPGAKHNLSVMMHPVEYGGRAVRFLDEHLARVRRAEPVSHRFSEDLEVASSSFVPALSKNRPARTPAAAG